MSEQITVVSTANPEGKTTLSDLASGKAEETKSASVEKTDEKKEVSEASSVEGDEKAQKESEETSEQKPKKNSGFKKRIKALTAEKYELKARIAYLEGRESTKENKNDSTKTIDSKDKEPNENDFENHIDFVKAQARWEARQESKKELDAREAEAKKKELEKEKEKRSTDFKQKIETFKESHEDFEDVIESAQTPSDAVSELILNSETPAELMYALAKNKDEYARICKLAPLEAAREMGRFEEKFLKTDSKKETKTTTKAPPPVKPLGNKTTGSGKKSIFDKDLTQAEYEKLRDEGASA